MLEGSPRFYGRLGFEYAAPLGIEMILPSWAPAEAAQVLRLATYHPSIRGRVVYPPSQRSDRNLMGDGRVCRVPVRDTLPMPRNLVLTPGLEKRAA